MKVRNSYVSTTCPSASIVAATMKRFFASSKHDLQDEKAKEERDLDDILRDENSGEELFRNNRKTPEKDEERFVYVFDPKERERIQKRRDLHWEINRQLVQEVHFSHEGSPLLPPAVPAGWRLQHRPGTRLLEIERIETLRSSRSSTSLPHNADPTKPLTLSPYANPFQSEVQSKSVEKQMKHQSLLDKVLSPRGGKSHPGSYEGISPQPKVKLFVPFQSQDPSFADVKVNVSEQVFFDALITKKTATRKGGGGGKWTAAHDPSASCLYLQCAAVNSQFRVRSFQVLPYKMFLSASSSPYGTSSLPFEQPFHFQHLRLEKYQGPCFSDLSFAVKNSLLEYLYSRCGLNHEVLEFICQAAFHCEEEEYLAWLARLGQFTNTGENFRVEEGTFWRSV